MCYTCVAPISGPCTQCAVLATTAMVQDVCRLYPYVRDEMRTHTCGSGSGVAAVMSAVPILVSIASRSAQCSEKRRPVSVCRISETGCMKLKSVL